jgi:hypothetical protein
VALDGLEVIIIEALTIELERAGLTGIEAVLKDGPIVWTDETVLQYAESVKTDFVLAARYSYEQSDNVQLELRWYDVQQKRLTTAVRRDVKIDLFTDDVIAAAVQEILDRISGRLGEVMAAKPPLQEPTPERTPERVQSGPKPAVPHLFEFAVGFSPFLAMGPAKDYFQAGILPSFYGNYRFATAAGIFGVGLYIGLSRFTADGLEASSKVTLIPIGLDIRYTTLEEAFLGLSVHLNGGPAVMLAYFDHTAPLSKIVAYIQGGVGLNLHLGRRLILVFDLGYLLFFERPYPIMGFTPALFAALRV